MIGFCERLFWRLLIENSAPDKPPHQAKKFFFNAARDAFSQCSDDFLCFRAPKSLLYRLPETPQRLLSLSTIIAQEHFAPQTRNASLATRRESSDIYQNLSLSETPKCVLGRFPSALEILCSNCFKKVFLAATLPIALLHSLILSVIMHIDINLNFNKS